MSKQRQQSGIAPTKQQRKAARLLAHGASFMDALTAAGYSPAQARKGLARVIKSRGLMEALQQEMAKFPPDVRANIVRLRLLQNVINGEDKATRSARLLGADKEVNLWQEEQGNKVVVIQAPMDWKPKPIPDDFTIESLPQVQFQKLPDYEG